MDEYKQLKAFLDNLYSELKRKLKILRQEELDYSSEKELINIDGKNVLSGGRRKEIFMLYPFIEKKFKKIDLLGHFIYNIKKGKFDEINPYEFRVTINELGCNNPQEIIDSFRELKRNSDKDENYTDGIDKLTKKLLEIFIMLSNDINEKLLKAFEEKNGIKDYSKEIDSLLFQLDNLKKYNIFDDNGNIIKYFDSIEEIDEFFEWIKNNVDDNLQELVIPLLMKEELLKENIELSREQEILKNRDKLIEELQKEYLDISNLDLSNYNDVEKNIINDGLEIYKELREKIKDRNDLLKDQDSLDIDEKQIFYLLNNRFNWDVILFDIENNIIPKISDNKENTINTFKLVISLYDKEKQELNRRNDLLDDIYEQIESYEELVRFGDKYNTNQYFYVIREQIYEDDDRFPKGISRKQIEMSYFLNNVVKKEIEKLKEIRERIESNIQNHNLISEAIDKELDSLKEIYEVDIDSLSDEFDKIYENACLVVNNFKEELKKEFEKSGKYIPSELSGKPKNLVFSIFDIDESKISKYRKTFSRTKQDLSFIDQPSFREPKVKVLYRDEKDKTKYDIPHVDFFRIRQLNSKRSGFIKIYPSKGVRELLRKKYNLDEDFEVYGIIDSVTKVSKNSDYEPLIDKINSNIDEIVKIGELFNNGDNVLELFQVIDSGIERLDSLVSDDKKEL